MTFVHIMSFFRFLRLTHFHNHFHRQHLCHPAVDFIEQSRRVIRLSLPCGLQRTASDLLRVAVRQDVERFRVSFDSAELNEFRIHRSGTDGGCRDAAVTQFFADAVSERGHIGFSGTVHGHARIRAERRDGRHVDNRRTGSHVRQENVRHNYTPSINVFFIIA